jgi:hypothetical protein
MSYAACIHGVVGSFVGCKDDLKAVWGRTPVGHEANATPVHQ